MAPCPSSDHFFFQLSRLVLGLCFLVSSSSRFTFSRLAFVLFLALTHHPSSILFSLRGCRLLSSPFSSRRAVFGLTTSLYEKACPFTLFINSILSCLPYTFFTTLFFFVLSGYPFILPPKNGESVTLGIVSRSLSHVASGLKPWAFCFSSLFCLSFRVKID